MPARRSRLTASFVVIGLILIGAGAALYRSAPEPDTREALGEQPVSVRSLELGLRTVQREADVSGLLQERRSVEIFSETDGRVMEVGAEELDRVSSEQLLVRIDPFLAELAVARAEAALARAESTLRLARAGLARQQSLEVNSVASKQTLDEAINAEAVAGANVKEAHAALEQARDQLAKKVIRAPFAGELRVFPIEVGEIVQPGQRVAELLEVDRLRITIGLSDREVVAVSPDTTARIAVEARPEEIFEGTVSRIGAAVDPVSRKFPVQIEVSNAHGRLLPGMVARVQLALGAPARLLAIPREAMLLEFGMPFVFVLKHDAEGGWQAERRRVAVRDIPFKPVEVEVLSGLEPGERIALSHLRQLQTGTLVEPGIPARSGDPAEAVLDRRGEVDARAASPVPFGGGGE